MTMEFSSETEFIARNMMQKLLGVAYMSPVVIQGWTLADVTRGVYKTVLSHEEKRRGRRKKSE